jgi:hypothetical protein
MGIARGVRRIRKQRGDPWKRFRELWLTDDAPALPAMLLRAVARGAVLETRIWAR